MSLRRRMMMGLAGQPPRQDPLYTLDATTKGFLKRITADGHTFNYPISYGNLSSIKGNTLVWNQLMSKVEFANSNVTYTYDGNTVVVNGTPSSSILTYNQIYQCKANDKVYIKYRVSNFPTNTNTRVLFQIYDATNSNTIWSITNANASSGATNEEYRYSNIFTHSADSSSVGVRIRLDADMTYNNVEFTYPIVINLTQMFGSGNEPTLEEFEALFPLDYYNYNSGELLNFNGTALKSVGFNLWDEVWEVGSIDRTTGQDASHSSKIRSKNYCPVFPNTTYYIKATAAFDIMFYDASYNYISYTQANNTTFVTPDNCRYIRFRESGTTYGVTYNNDICINLSNSSKNGTYVPYKEDTIALNIPTITGKLNGEGDSVTVFADGMKSAGTVYDEIYKENGVWKAAIRTKKVAVDMTEGTWRAWGEGYYCQMLTSFPCVSSGSVINCISDKMIAAPSGTFNSTDKVGYVGVNALGVYVSKTDYTNRANIAPYNVIYRLATPLIYVLDDELQETLNVATGGTESILPENGSEPTTSPAKLSIDYYSINNRRRSGLPNIITI